MLNDHSVMAFAITVTLLALFVFFLFLRWIVRSIASSGIEG